MKCPNCTITRYVETVDEERTFSPPISDDDGVCDHCGYELPLLDSVLDRLPDRPLTDEDVEQLQEIVGVVKASKTERTVAALRPNTLYGQVRADQEFCVDQQVTVSMLEEEVSYLWQPVRVEESGDDEIYKSGGWREIERLGASWTRDPLPYALNEASPEDDGGSAVPGEGQVGNDPWN